MPKINVTVKWSGKKFENMELGKLSLSQNEKERVILICS